MRCLRRLALSNWNFGYAQQKERAAVAEKALESERVERLKLEALVSPRRLTIDEQKGIGKACASLYTYGPKKRIKIRSYGLDGEGAALAVQIGASLNSSRLYTAADIAGIIVTGGFDTGVIISAPTEDEKFATCLRSAFVTIGRLTNVEVNPARRVGNAEMGGAASMGVPRQWEEGDILLPPHRYPLALR